MSMKRRQFIKAAGAAGAATGFALSGMRTAAAGSGGHVVVVGGGAGGATCAKYIRHFDPSVEVTVIEPKTEFATCFMSNWVIGGLKEMNWISHGYSDWSKKHGIKVIHDLAVDIDAENQTVTTKGGKTVKFDRCVVSPGVGMKYDAIDGYTEAASHLVPHAWHAGPQTVTLRKQLEAMKDGGLFVMAAPPNPFRCPPGPYERVSLVANYLKQNKPKSKILILDAKDKFSKQGLFTAGWEKYYGYGTDNSMIEWRSKANDGTVTAVDADTRTAKTTFDEIKADVLNVIPPQTAGHIAHKAGLTDESGWCPVDHVTWESKMQKNVHVIGDAAIASPLPKSGFAANSEGKVCAAAIVALLKGQDAPTPSWVNTCYSLVTPNHGISVAMVYDSKDGKVSKVEGSGGLTPKGGDNTLEAVYAESWYVNIIDDMFG